MEDGSSPLAEEACDGPGPSEVDTQKASHLVKVHKDKLTVTYKGKANHNHDVGAVQADRPFSSDVLIGYFEMTIVNQGERSCMAIGLGNSSFNNTRQPGWYACMPAREKQHSRGSAL